MASCRPLLLRVKWPRTTITAKLNSYFACILLLAGAVHALDPNKRVTQYMHMSWRIQDGSLPSGMYEIAQTSDGFFWFLSLPGDLYRFDGIRFVPWRFPAGVPFDSQSSIFADHAGGLWLAGDKLIRLKDGLVTSQFELQGRMFQSISEDADSSLWVATRREDQPLCHVTEGAFKCYGKADGISISPINAILTDGKGGFWLGGQTALVHWHAGISEAYRSEEVRSLARGPDGTLWIGTSSEARGKGLK